MSTPSLHHESAGRSTGPRTPEGKANSSRNAVRHGCCSKKTLFIDDETPEQWEELKKGCLDSYDISTEVGKQLASEVAEELWQLRRTQRQYDNVVHRIYSQRPNMADWLPEDHKAFSLAQRYVTAASRCRDRAVATAERHERTRILDRRCVAEELRAEALATRHLSEAELNQAKAAKIHAKLEEEAQTHVSTAAPVFIAEEGDENTAGSSPMWTPECPKDGIPGRRSST